MELWQVARTPLGNREWGYAFDSSKDCLNDPV